jgi:hypothetical protein
MSAITIRPAHHSDDIALARLAALDSARPLLGDVTLAEVGGRIVAAIGSDGRAIADPFEHSAGMVALLRTHEAAGSGRANRAHGLLQRPASAALRLAA